MAGIQRSLFSAEPDRLAGARSTKTKVNSGGGGVGLRNLEVLKELRTPPATTIELATEVGTPRGREILARLGSLGCRGATAVLAVFGVDRLQYELDQLVQDLSRGVPIRSPVGVLIYRCRQEDPRIHLQPELSSARDTGPAYHFRRWGT